MKSLLCPLILVFSTVFLTGCFDFLNPANKEQSSMNTVSAITAENFPGIASATNKISGILLSWPAVSDPSLVKSYRVYRVTGNTNTLIASIAPSLTSYMDGTVNPGAIYTYMVKAVDKVNLEDGNTKTLKSLSWAGIDTVVADSRTSMQVNIKAQSAVVDEVRIYGQLIVGGPKTLLATATGSADTVSLSSLRTGFSYIISAQAYVASLGKEDGNDITFTASTLTQGYDNDGASLPLWSNIMAARAFGEAPGAPTHPVTPGKSPKDRIVELAFNSFRTAGPSAKYVVTRVIDGFTMDSSSTKVCTDTTFTSCRVCDNVTAVNNVVNCSDSAVAASPARYRYSMSLVQKDSVSGDTWAEPLPTDPDVLSQFSVLIPIPPANMVLVQRDAANYEMCTLLKKTPDPNNHNRCVYSGVGAIPYSTGHNKPALNLSYGFYDFGYNLFVDRWETACNWTMASQGGMCGPNHSAGDCIGAYSSLNYPPATQGKVGDVYALLGNNGPVICYMATAQNPTTHDITWERPNDVAIKYSNTKELFKKMFTNDPVYVNAAGVPNSAIPGRRAKTNYYVGNTTSSQICSSMEDPSYGTKRISRTREYVIYSAPALLPYEPYTYGSYVNFINKVQVNSAFHNSSATYGCETGVNKDIPAPSLAQMLDYTNYPAYKEMLSISGLDSSGANPGPYGGSTYVQFMIGAVATIDCQSRYGVQDMMRRKFMSDALAYNPTTMRMTGTISPYDNGNRDFLADLTGGTAGFTLDVSGFIQNGVNNGYAFMSTANITAFIPPLAMPITTASYSSDYIPKVLMSENYGFTMLTPPLAGLARINSVQMENRWWPVTYVTPNTVSVNIGETRCVLPAE